MLVANGFSRRLILSIFACLTLVQGIGAPALAADSAGQQKAVEQYNYQSKPGINRIADYKLFKVFQKLANRGSRLLTAKEISQLPAFLQVADSGKKVEYRISSYGGSVTLKAHSIGTTGYYGRAANNSCGDYTWVVQHGATTAAQVPTPGESQTAASQSVPVTASAAAWIEAFKKGTAVAKPDQQLTTDEEGISSFSWKAGNYAAGYNTLSSLARQANAARLPGKFVVAGMNNTANCLFYQKKYSEAGNMYQRALTILARNKVAGPYSKAVTENLMICRKMQGKSVKDLKARGDFSMKGIWWLNDPTTNSGTRTYTYREAVYKQRTCAYAGHWSTWYDYAKVAYFFERYGEANSICSLALSLNPPAAKAAEISRLQRQLGTRLAYSRPAM